MGDFDDEKHPRDEKGRFGLSAWADRRAGTLLKRAEDTGGFSHRPREGSPKDGFMVSRDPKEGFGHIVEITKLAQEIADRVPRPTAEEVRAEVRKQTLDAVKAWLKKNAPEVVSRPDHYLGGWIERHPVNGVSLHLDVSEKFSDRFQKNAVKEGRARNQVSVWDVRNKREIQTGGTGR